MQWQDNGIIIGAFPLSDSSDRMIILTKNKGMRSGLYRKKKNHSLFIGDIAHITWQGRLAEHLGRFSIEVENCVYSQIIYKRQKILLLASLSELLIKILPDSHEYPEIYNGLEHFLYKDLSSNSYMSLYVYFELFLLKNLGFPLDFEKCAVTGKTEDLTYVSPSSGRAVSKLSAGKYIDKMLLLPRFLVKRNTETDNQELKNALNLTGYFLSKYLFHGQPLPQSRTLLLNSFRQRRTA